MIKSALRELSIMQVSFIVFSTIYMGWFFAQNNFELSESMGSKTASIVSLGISILVLTVVAVVRLYLYFMGISLIDLLSKTRLINAKRAKIFMLFIIIVDLTRLATYTFEPIVNFLLVKDKLECSDTLVNIGSGIVIFDMITFPLLYQVLFLTSMIFFSTM